MDSALTPALAARLRALVDAYPSPLSAVGVALASPRIERATNLANGVADSAACVYVWRLRRALGRDAIETVEGGYRLSDALAARMGAGA